MFTIAMKSPSAEKKQETQHFQSLAQIQKRKLKTSLSESTKIKKIPQVVKFSPQDRKWREIRSGGEATIYETPTHEAVRVFQKKPLQGLIKDLSIPLHEDLQNVSNVEYSDPWIMEYQPLATADLHDKIEGKYSVVDALRWFYTSLCGLVALHQQGIIHNDIKPGNILIHGNDNSRAVLADFGLISRDPHLVDCYFGTLEYKPPETALGHNVCTKAADVWSIALTFLYLFNKQTIWISNKIGDSTWVKGLLGKMFNSLLVGQILDGSGSMNLSLPTTTWLKDNARIEDIELFSFLVEAFNTDLKPSKFQLESLFKVSTLEEYQKNLTKLRNDFEKWSLYMKDYYKQAEIPQLLHQMFAWDPDQRISSEQALKGLIFIINTKYKAYKLVRDAFAMKNPTQTLHPTQFLEEAKKYSNGKEYDLFMMDIFLDLQKYSTITNADIVTILNNIPQIHLFDLSCLPPHFDNTPTSPEISQELKSQLDSYIAADDSFDSDEENEDILRLWNATGDPKSPRQSYDRSKAIVNTAFGDKDLIHEKDFNEYLQILKDLNWKLNWVFQRDTKNFPHF